jgi:hypothetical protein
VKPAAEPESNRVPGIQMCRSRVLLSYKGVLVAGMASSCLASNGTHAHTNSSTGVSRKHSSKAEPGAIRRLGTLAVIVLQMEFVPLKIVASGYCPSIRHVTLINGVVARAA